MGYNSFMFIRHHHQIGYVVATLQGSDRLENVPGNIIWIPFFLDPFHVIDRGHYVQTWWTHPYMIHHTRSFSSRKLKWKCEINRLPIKEVLLDLPDAIIINCVTSICKQQDMCICDIISSQCLTIWNGDYSLACRWSPLGGWMIKSRYRP